MSIKPLTRTITVNIQICVHAAADQERAFITYRYETASQTVFYFQPHSIITIIQIITEVLG